MATQTTAIPGSGYGNPYLDSLIWGDGWTGGPITYSFGSGWDPFFSVFGDVWFDYEMQAFRNAVQVFENVCNIDFQEVSTYAESDIVWWSVGDAFLGDGVLGRHEVPDETFCGSDL